MSVDGVGAECEEAISGVVLLKRQRLEALES